MAVHCAACGAENQPQARFCGNCGAPLALTCPRCGAGAPTGASFCPGCGQPLSAQPAGIPAYYGQPAQPTLQAAAPYAVTRRAGPPAWQRLFRFCLVAVVVVVLLAAATFLLWVNTTRMPPQVAVNFVMEYSRQFGPHEAWRQMVTDLAKYYFQVGIR